VLELRQEESSREGALELGGDGRMRKQEAWSFCQCQPPLEREAEEGGREGAGSRGRGDSATRGGVGAVLLAAAWATCGPWTPSESRV